MARERRSYATRSTAFAQDLLCAPIARLTPGQPNSESLHVYIYRLRAKLAHFGLQVETMVNVGYRLIITKN